MSIMVQRAAVAVAAGLLGPALLGAGAALAAAPSPARSVPTLSSSAPSAVVPSVPTLSSAVVANPALASAVVSSPVLVARQPGAPGDPAGTGQGWPGQGNPQPPPGVVFVEVRPSVVQPGYLVGIRANCRDNSVPAIVVSDAFGRVQAHPQRGELTASAMVRERTRPGNYRVKLECRDGATASTMLQVVKKVHPSPGPHTGFGGGAGPSLGGLLVPGGLALTIGGAIVGIVAARRPRGVTGG